MPGTVINEIVFKTLITYSHIVVLCVFRNGRLMWEVNDKMSYEKFKVSQTILPKRGTIRKTQTYQHVLWCCPEGTPEGTTRNPVRLGARGPKFQQTSIENRSKTSISRRRAPSLPTSFSGGATSRKTPRVPVQPLVELQHGWVHGDAHLGWNPQSKKEPNRAVNLGVCDDSRGTALTVATR